MNARSRFILLPSLLICACAQVPPERRLIEEAAAALGGKERLQSVHTLAIAGEGVAPMAGQSRLPDGDEPVWKVGPFERRIDLDHERTRVKQVRVAQFLFAGATTQQLDQSVDGAVAFNTSPDGTATRAGDEAVRDRRLEMLHHPLVIIREALDPGAKIGNLRQQGDDHLVDVTTGRGETLTLAVDGRTKLPSRVSSMADNPNLGDVDIVTAFSDWEEVNGLKLPKRLTTRMDKYLQFDLRVSRNTVDADVGDLAAPEAVSTAAPPVPRAVVVTAEPVAKGIWWLAGSGNHRSIVFEFSDHLTLFEVPLNEARSQAVIDKARTLSSKPLTTAIVSHHHFDHSGGLRVAVAEGLRIVTQRANEAFFKDLVARKHTIVPDELAKTPKPLVLDLVDEEMTLKDPTLEVQLYHLADNPREGTNLFAYVPRDHMLVQADLYDSTWLQHPWGANVLANIEQHKLKVEKDVPVHGTVEGFADMVKTIKAKPPARN
jgi:hypothetical protein